VVELTGTLLSSLSDSLLLLMNVALGDTLWWVEIKLLCVSKQPTWQISLFWLVHFCVFYIMLNDDKHQICVLSWTVGYSYSCSTSKWLQAPDPIMLASEKLYIIVQRYCDSECGTFQGFVWWKQFFTLLLSDL
jgi:hypothetical protein